jgi:hypothetical protein
MKYIGWLTSLLLVFPVAAHGQFPGGIAVSGFGPRPYSAPSVFFSPFTPLNTFNSPFLMGYPGVSAVVLPPIVINAHRPASNAPPGRGMPGELAGRFRPVLPADRARARLPVRPELGPLPRPVPPDPKAERSALVRDGRGAFATAEYGRAAELLRSALAADPESSEAAFLLGQSLVALGKYADAAAVIFQGLGRHPDWPATGPILRELYGGGLDRLAEHRRALEDAAAADQSDAALQFLQAYVRWFDGDRIAAREQFRKLHDRITRPESIDRFLSP